MKAGRELDALVATKVLGWHERIDVDYKPMQIEWYERDRFQAYVNCNTQLQSLNMFCPSKSIADAWRVVEHMKNSLFTSRYRFVKALREEMRLLEDEDLTISPSWWIFYLTPEKICLAALKAVQL